jgi:hypothetical protein
MSRKPFAPWKDTVPGVWARLLVVIFLIACLLFGRWRVYGIVSFLGLGLIILLLIPFSLCGYFWWFRERGARRSSVNDN